jgi:hypothetical protein
MLAVSPYREWDIAFCSGRAAFSAFAWQVSMPGRMRSPQHAEAHV